MTRHLSTAPVGTPVAAVYPSIFAEFHQSSDVLELPGLLRHISAKMVYLAELARAQRKHDLEAILIQGAAEVLTSIEEIAKASFAGDLIVQMSLHLESIEDRLSCEGLPRAISSTH